jgi:hypothetical protein
LTGLPYVAYWKGSKLIFPNDEPEDTEDPADTGVLPAHTQEVSQTLNDHTSTKEAAADSTGDSNNLTTSALARRDEKWAVDIRFHGRREHVDTLRKDRINKRMKACLQTIGSPKYSGGDHQSPFSFLCRWYDDGCVPSCIFENIVYNSGKNTYATKAYLEITAYWSEIREDKHPCLREIAVCTNVDKACPRSLRNCSILWSPTPTM